MKMEITVCYRQGRWGNGRILITKPQRIRKLLLTVLLVCWPAGRSWLQSRIRTEVMNIVVHLFSTVHTNCDDVTLMSRRTELVHPVAKKYLHSGFRSRNRPGLRERAKAPGHSHQVCVCVWVCVGGCLVEGERQKMCVPERWHPDTSRLLLGVIAVMMMMMIVKIMTAKATIIFRRCAKIKKKIRNHLKILGARRVILRKFHFKDQPILGATVHKMLVVWTTWRPGFVHPWHTAQQLMVIMTITAVSLQWG